MFHCKSSGGADEQVHFHILHHMHHTRLHGLHFHLLGESGPDLGSLLEKIRAAERLASAFAGPILTPLGLKRAHRGAYARYTAIAGSRPIAGADDVVFFAWHSCNLKNLGRVPPPEPTDRFHSPIAVSSGDQSG